jgi:hypothetical protein
MEPNTESALRASGSKSELGTLCSVARRSDAPPAFADYNRPPGARSRIDAGAESSAGCLGWVRT